MSLNDYEPVIGLEVHVRLDTGGKLFCGCPLPTNMLELRNEANSRICPECIGHPGAMPTLQQDSLIYAIALAFALSAREDDIELVSYFERKHYFYWDLPKNYQITQNKSTICKRNLILVSVPRENERNFFEVKLNHIHLEEDAAAKRELGAGYNKSYLVDFNRSGAVLAEIVTEPDIYSADDAISFLKHLQRLLKWHGLGTGDLQAGDFRCDTNISVRRKNDPIPKWKVELKNVARLDGLKSAIKTEVHRLIEVLKSGEIPSQETRDWDDERKISIKSREKETAADYWYYIEPDLQNVVINSDIIKKAKNLLQIDLNTIIQDFINANYDLHELYNQILADLILTKFAYHSLTIGADFTHYRKLRILYDELVKTHMAQSEKRSSHGNIWEAVSIKTVETIIGNFLDGNISSTQIKAIVAMKPWENKDFISIQELFEACDISEQDESNIKEKVNNIINEILKEDLELSSRWLEKGDFKIANFIQGRIMRQLPKGIDGKYIQDIINEYYNHHSQ